MNIGMTDKLDMMIALVAKDCGNDDVEMFDNLDTSSVVLDKYFYRKRDRIIAKYKHHPAILIFKKGLFRVAVAILIIMSLGFTAVMAITPLREALFETVIEWYEDYLTIRYEPADKEDHTNKENDSGITDNTETPPANDPIVTPPTIIEEVRKPTYLPAGMVEDVLASNKLMVYIDYYLNNEYIFTFTQMLLTEREKLIDNEGAELSIVDINGNEGVVIQYENKTGLSIVWSDGEYVYQLITQSIDLNELMFYCQSVQ